MSPPPPISTIVLAYSGGLDTSVIVPWLKEHYRGARVICMAADIGQGHGELDGVREKALASGADDCVIEDLRHELVEDFIWPTLRAGAVYGRKYLLGTSIARPLIARRQVEVARRMGADALAHGCTGKGNDQVRFELTFAAFAPDLHVIAPWREWDIRSREDALAYAAAHNVPVSATAAKIYSRDRNLWHLSHEGGALEDPNWTPTEDVFELTTAPAAAPDTPEMVTIAFERGTPVSVNGATLDPVALVAAVNAVGARHGIGRVDLVEDRRDRAPRGIGAGRVEDEHVHGGAERLPGQVGCRRCGQRGCCCHARSVECGPCRMHYGARSAPRTGSLDAGGPDAWKRRGGPAASMVR